MFWCTPRTVWVLAADGLTGAGPDSTDLRFALRPMGVRDAIGVLDRFLEPAQATAIRTDLYAGDAPEPAAPPVLSAPPPAFCGKCGVALKPGARFCGGCGAPAA